MTPFGKLTVGEKYALLLACHNGHTIEIYSGPSQIWQVTSKPEWLDGQPYRIKPKPKMQAEYWVEFDLYGVPVHVHKRKPVPFVREYGYIFHHPAVEIKE